MIGSKRKLSCARRWIGCGGRSATPTSSAGGSGSASTGRSSLATSVTGVITPTTVDEDVARAQEPHAGKSDTWQIVAVEPQRRLAFRWHPYAVEDRAPTTRRSRPRWWSSPSTETSDGVLLRIVESGFDSYPGRASRVGVRGQQRGLGRADRAGAEVPGTQREGVSTSAVASPRRRSSMRSAIRIVCASSRGCATAGRARRRKSRRWCR